MVRNKAAGVWQLSEPAVQTRVAPITVSSQSMIHAGVTWTKDAARGVWTL